MALLEPIALVSALIALAAALRVLPSRVLLLPVAMLGATSGIALGLLDAGHLWLSGGVVLLAVGPAELVNQRAFEALFTNGRRATATALHPFVCAVASGSATALFAIA